MANASDAIEMNKTPDPMDPSNEIVIQSENIQSRVSILDDIGDIVQATGEAISDYVEKKEKNKEEAKKVKKKVSETAQILQILKDQDKDDDKESKWETATNASKDTFTAITGAIEKFDTGNPGEIVSGVFDILGSLSQFAALAGPKGQIIAAIVGPFCSIISSLFGAKPEPEESQEALIHRVVTAALDIQTSDDLRSSAAGVQKDLIERMKYVQEFFDRADEMGMLDRYFITDDSYVSSGSDFIGKLKYYIEKDIATTDDKTAKRNAVYLSTYCTLVYIRCQHLFMLSALYASHKDSRLVAIATKKIAEDQRKLCIELLDKVSHYYTNHKTWQEVVKFPKSILVIMSGCFGKSVWIKLPREYSDIAISGCGNHMWGLDFHNSIFYMATPFENFQQASPNASSISVSNSNQQVWIVLGDMSLRCKGPNGNWLDRDGAGKVISVSPCGEFKALVGQDDNIWIQKPPHFNWVKVTSNFQGGNFEGDFKDVSISSGGEHMWAVTKHGKVLYKSDSDDLWLVKVGNYKQIRVNPDGSKVFGLNSVGRIYCRNGPSGSEYHFTKGDALDGMYISISVSKDKLVVATSKGASHSGYYQWL